MVLVQVSPPILRASVFLLLTEYKSGVNFITLIKNVTGWQRIFNYVKIVLDYVEKAATREVDTR